MAGLRCVFRQPALGLAEIAWRWTTATVAWLLLGFLLLEYLDSLPVTKDDMLLLRSGVPSLVLAAAQRLLLSGIPRLLVASMICLIAICAAWVFAASVGRAATIVVLLDRVKDEHASEPSNLPNVNFQRSPATPARLMPKTVVLLHCLRAIWLLAALSAVIGAAMVAGFVGFGHDPHPGFAVLLILFLGGAIAILWGALDWLLSTAPIFAMRDGESTLSAISKAGRFSGERFGALVRSSGLFGAIHLAVFFVVTSFVSTSLAAGRIFPLGAVVILVLVLTLVYFAVIDFLRVARLAAYIYIAVPGPGIQAAED